MTVEEFCRELERKLASAVSLDEKLTIAASALSQAFSVRTDEVAIFGYDNRLDSLQFLWPKKLSSAGSVPLTAHQSLVAMTARERKAYLDNTFASTPHLFIFERFRLDISGGVPIQKIMSAPVVADDAVKGVVQVSRKGETRENCGQDFSSGNLAVLTRIAALIAPYLP